MATAEQLGALDSNGKPIFRACDVANYVPTPDRQLTLNEQLEWKSFQLNRALMSISRRDAVQRALAGEAAAPALEVERLMGTPYPIIEEKPGIFDVVRAMRVTDHVCALSFAWVSYQLTLAAAYRVHLVAPTYLRQLQTGLCLVVGYSGVQMLSYLRLRGWLPNEREALHYGVRETPERLRHKAELWAKYAAYKQEWCRRYDYHVFGQRPGEHWGFLAACALPAVPVTYSTRTDFPPRKNPMFLSPHSLANEISVPGLRVAGKRDVHTPLHDARPENKYMFRLVQSDMTSR